MNIENNCQYFVMTRPRETDDGVGCAHYSSCTHDFDCEDYFGCAHDFDCAYYSDCVGTVLHTFF